MRQTFIKDGLVRSFEVADDKVMATLEIDGVWMSNPTLEAFYTDGWQDWITPVPEPYVPTYAELVEQYIREHGYETYGAELAVLNNYAENSSAYFEEWKTYMNVRREAKEWATKQL